MKTTAMLLLATMFNFCCYAQVKDTITEKPARQLKGVSITARSPLIRQMADRIIYDMQADPESKASSLLDIMRKVPYLSVDANDNVSLNGSTGYRVFINGRPSALLANNAKEVLRSIPASTIKSIEVITNPPARYDAEGLAGIINIITIKQTNNGYKGSGNLYEKGPVGGPGVGTAFTLKKAKVDISLLAGINRYNIPRTNKDIERVGSADSSVLRQHSVSNSNSRSAYAGVEASYEMDSLDLVSCQINWNSSKSTGVFAQASEVDDLSHHYHYQLGHNEVDGDGGTDATISYQRSFKANKDQVLTFSYQYLTFDNKLSGDIVFSNRLNYPVPDYRQFNLDSYIDHTVQIDYIQPFKKLVVEGGLKTVFRNNESDYRYDSSSPASGKYETDRGRSDIFNNSRDILAVYNSYSYQVAGWQLKAGVRLEQTIINMDTRQGAEHIRQQYLNILPSVLICRKLDSKNAIALSYSERIQRPSAAELNPFIDRSDPGSQAGGNPYLRPIVSDAFKLSYLKTGKGTIDVSLCGMFFNDVFSPFPHYDPITNTTFTRYENYGKGRVMKVSIYLNYPVTPKWNVIVDADFRHIAVNGIADTITIKNSGLNFYAFTSAAYSLPRDWRISADCTYRMGGLALPLGISNGAVASSFGISKGVAQSKVTLSATINNPFTKYRYSNEVIAAADFLQTTRNQSYYRRFIVTLNYRFGKLKEEVRKSRRTIGNDNTSDL